MHFPTLTVRQTLEFALESKTPKRLRHKIPEILEIYGRVFGISHVMDSLVGNEYIRGVSGGEKKRLSIIESLGTDAAVTAWDNSTRGLDAASAVDYARSLRIMTDTCGKATVVTLYQASDAVYDLVDKVMVIDEGRMLYQGPAKHAKKYFEDLGYECQPRQTTTDFLTGVTCPETRTFRHGYEQCAPKSTAELESIFKQSDEYKAVQIDMQNYENELAQSQQFDESESCRSNTTVEEFKALSRNKKSRFVSSKSPYNTSLAKQILLCTKRQWWLLKGYPIPLYLKLISSIVLSLLFSSMFYDQPANVEGAFSRGGFFFYSVLTLAWIQLAELEDAVQGRDIISRQKRFAFVRPSAVTLSRVVYDFATVFVTSIPYCIISYFMAGLKMEVSEYHSSVLVYFCY